MDDKFDFLLDATQAEKFLSRISKAIFGVEGKVKILEIKRAETYNPDSFNIFYRVELNKKTIEIRGSASKKSAKKTEFKALQWCYQNGLSSGDILSPKPLAYFEKYDLMFYENVQGNFLVRHLADNLDKLLLEIETCALALKKFHDLPKPNFPLWNAAALFHCNMYEKSHLERYYPEFGRKINEILGVIKAKIHQMTSYQMCHGDFQPTNIIISQGKTYILDFGLVSIIDHEYDVASFVNQLRVMLKRFGNFHNFAKLKDKFLNVYGPCDGDKYIFYDLLSNIRILITFCLTNRKLGGDNLEYMELVYGLVEESLAKCKIE